jgi:hypothetical protein
MVENINYETPDSWFDEIKRRFEVISGGYRELIAYIKRNLPQTAKNRVLPYICERAALEAERMVNWYDNDEPPEFFAWTARNVLEISYITEYVTKADEDLKKFLNRALDDIKDIGEGLKELALENLEAIKTIEETQQKYELKKYKLKGKMPARTKDLAKAVSNEKEHKSFFKIYSKYVHPTAWLILSETRATLHEDGKKAFFNQGYIYCERVFNTISESTGFDETEGFKNIKYQIAANG